MADDKYLYWSCNKEKFMKISSSKSFVEKLGYKLGTEWYLEINTKIYDPGCDPNPFKFASGIIKYSSYDCISYPFWNFYLKRKDNLKDTRVTLNFFTKGNSIYRIDVPLKNKDSIHCCELNFQKLESPCLNLILVFQTAEENMVKVEERVFSNLNNLSEDFQFMLDKGCHADVTLKCETELLQVHKCIMSTRSPVFEAMFNSQLEETKKNEVVIEDMAPPVLRALVCFMYSGQVKDLNFRLATDLLYVSEKYQIRALKEGCAEYLQSILCSENAFEILEMGDLYDENLKSNSMEYICKHFNELKTKEEWRIIKKKNPLLAMEIYSYFEPFLEKDM